MTNPEIFCATKPPKHHFFGFHDLPSWNYTGDKLLGLQVEIIDRPPKPGERAGVGYVFNNEFIKIGSTSAWNFPQGARMQWLGNLDHFIVNTINKKGVCASDLYDTVTNKRIEHLNFPCHYLHKDCKTAFFLNYARLHRLGAYGYAGCIDNTGNDCTPNKDGIFVGDIVTCKSKLLIAISDVANYPKPLIRPPFGHHYLTHLLLNPSNKRLAFLHRFPLADGGEITRLMSISIDGSNLRCIATGFLSHFDWKDDETILIFGRANSAIDTIRSNSLFTNPLVYKSARLAKNLLKTFKLGKASNVNSSFLLVKDNEIHNIKKIAQGVIDEDGHPMFCPTNRDWIINDTYPDKEGVRKLYLYSFFKNKRFELGEFKMIFDKPSILESNEYFRGVDVNVLKSIGKENLAFTRSGLHCDLHPRWDMHGKKAAFDSIHEGTRQIYIIDIQKLNVI